ncbi:MAG: hypothetical protein ACXV3F_04805 [Frankiaceae bacterium]
MRNFAWRVTAVALDVPVLMLSLLLEWRIRMRAADWRDRKAGLLALPSGRATDR